MNNILVVDDEKLVRETLKDILKINGFRVDSVADVDKAIKFLEDKEYHAVICDIILQKQSGLNLIKKMRDKNHKQPVILMTGYPDVETAQEAVKAKAYDYLTKPIQNDRLVHAVRDAVRQNKLRIDEKLLENRKKKYREDLEKLVVEKVKKLNESEIKYENLIEQSLISVFVMQNDKLRYVNQKFLELFKYTYEEIVDKKDLIDFVDDHFKKTISDKYEKLLYGNANHEQYTIIAKDKSGNELDLEIWCGNVIYEGNPAIQGIILDISERRAFQMKEKTYELRMMNEYKLASIGQFATGIAHNLNTPIAVVMSNAELLRLNNPGSPELDKIIRQAERMSHIIQGLLTKSGQEQSQKRQLIELNKLISTELEFLDSNLEFKHNVEKECQFDENLPQIYAVYSDFSQSIMNVLQNAIDSMYKRDTKKLSVITQQDDEKIIVIIKDTGCGISEENYIKLFDPFYTTKPNLDEKKGDEPTGTGLGLSTVHNLLTPYGVKIEVISELNIGTSFILRIPSKVTQIKGQKEKKVLL